MSACLGLLGLVLWVGSIGRGMLVGCAEFGGIGWVDLSNLVRLVKFYVLGFLSWDCFAGLDYVSKFWLQILF